MNLQTLEFDPFVSGYSFILWTKVPDWVEQEYPGFRAMTQKNFKAFQGIEDMELTTNDYSHTFNENMYQTAATITKNNKDRKSTRLNSSHVSISYAVFCLKKK